jgi:predicted TIM-barrel fold metal-dependent hydrolase
MTTLESAPSDTLADTLGMVSGDSHVSEPRHLWRDNLPAKYKGDALKGIEAGEDGSWEVVLEGQQMGSGAEAESARMIMADPEHRLKIMREEGIVGECIFPTIGLYVWMLTDPDVGAASCRVYNEWIADTLARSPRFKCAGLVPTWRVEDAVAEVRFIAEAGLGGVMIPAVATPEWNHRDWTPLWKAIEETGLPVVVHQGTGHSMFFYRGPGAGVANLLATQSMAPRMAGLLATSGVLAFHPDLHVVFVEYNIGWLGWAMDTLDFYTDSFAKYGTTGAGKKWINPELPEHPSFYMRRQIHATFQNDPVGIHNIRFTGPDSLIWGSDYPHGEGTYPHSKSIVNQLAGELDPAIAAKVFRETAAKLFHFSDEVLTTPV